MEAKMLNDRYLSRRIKYMEPFEIINIIKMLVSVGWAGERERK